MELYNNNRSIITLAPGRTCLFGDHQDYIGLPVIACAINRFVMVSAFENDSDYFNIKMPDIGEVRMINIYEQISETRQGDHLLSALKVLKRYGCIPDRGYDICISGNLPINAGVSSSSAVIITWIKFLLDSFGSNLAIINPERIAQIAYEAEVQEHNSPGGKMDQYTIGLGHVIYLETGDDLNYQLINKPLKGLIIGESGIPKETIEVLGELKKNAWKAIHEVQEKINDFDIKKVKKEDLPKYTDIVSDELMPFFYAAVSNHDITQKALKELKNKNLDYHKIGMLMNEHHRILRDVLKITVPKIDDMINNALKAGAYGAKIVGSGRGGSIVVLAPEENKEKIIATIKEAGAKDAYGVTVDPGARTIQKTNNLKFKTI